MTGQRRSPRVTVNDGAARPAAESPSTSLIREAAKSSVITDDRGRKLSVRKPGVLAQFKLVDALGGETATNQAYMQMVMPLIYLSAIDDDPIFPPTSKREVEALISRLDDDGLGALMGWYVEHIVSPTMQAIEDAERRASLKN